MSSNHDHGARAKNLSGEDRPLVGLALSSAVLPHPALIALVRLLAREAAAEWVAAEAKKDKLEGCGEEQR